MTFSLFAKAEPVRRFQPYNRPMARLGSWIEPFPEGIYVKPADAWVDPSQPKDTALVTHGHADHARGGHGAVWATPETLAIMDVRYGQQNANPVDYGESVTHRRGRGQLRPRRPCAGIGADRARLQRRAGGGVGRLQAPARPDLRAVRGHAVRHLHHRGDLRAAGVPPSRHGQRDRPAAPAAAAEPERCVLVGAYALGKAQRVIAELRARGHARADLLSRRDGAIVQSVRGAWRAARRAAARDGGEARRRWRGISSSARRPRSTTAGRGGCPTRSRRWRRAGCGSASARGRRNVELPLVISDHGDWDELTRTIREVAPKEVWITHGREDALMHWCMLHQVKVARAAIWSGRGG